VEERDLALAAAILARDRKATARFVELHGDVVFRFVWRRLSPRTESVDDVVQEVFLAAWRGLKTYTGEAPLRTWLLGIARHKVEDYYRRVLAEQPLTEQVEQNWSPAATDAEMEAALDVDRKGERAASILRELRYEHGLVLKWRYWDGRSAREMAAASGKSEKAIERLLARAREAFRRRWMEQDRGTA
jgi:RNA polymerase sigma-70 factor (ECF subfamily)